MIRFAGHLNYDEFRRAQWISTPWFLRWFGFLLLGLLVVVAFSGGGPRTMFDTPLDWLRVAALLGMGLYAILMPRRRIRTAWERTPLLHETVEGAIGDEGIVWETPSNKAKLAWDKIVRRKVAGEMILLYTSQRNALLMPRRYFATDADWQAATAVVTAA